MSIELGIMLDAKLKYQILHKNQLKYIFLVLILTFLII